MWVSDPVTFETTIKGIRGLITKDILCNDKTNRHIVSAQNLKLKSEVALAASEQFSWQILDREQMICLEKDDYRDSFVQVIKLGDEALHQANVSMVVIAQSNVNVIIKTQGI